MGRACGFYSRMCARICIVGCAVSDYNAFTNRATSYVVRLDVKETLSKLMHACDMLTRFSKTDSCSLFTSTFCASFAFVFTAFSPQFFRIILPPIDFCSYFPFYPLANFFFTLLDVFSLLYSYFLYSSFIPSSRLLIFVIALIPTWIAQLL